MRVTLFISMLLCVLLLANCTKDREFPIPSPTPPVGSADSILPGTLRINEFMAKGSSFPNELFPGCTDCDWLEIYNTTTDTIFFSSNAWYLTDDLTDSTKFELKDTLILPLGYLTIQCDGADTTSAQIHSNFNLSSGGESIALFYQGSALFAVDAYDFGPQSPGVAMARFPDGSVNWISTNNPTPNAPNQP
jgi:hypothetical protein